jgi:hypothetical protein
MTTDHPITPPPELVEQWLESTRSHDCIGAFPPNTDLLLATQAARWGADMELEACCELLVADHWETLSRGLRAFRRPKPPSLKEQALLQLDTLNADLAMHGMGCDLSQIRRALEALPDD